MHNHAYQSLACRLAAVWNTDMFEEKNDFLLIFTYGEINFLPKQILPP